MSEEKTLSDEIEEVINAEAKALQERAGFISRGECIAKIVFYSVMLKRGAEADGGDVEEDARFIGELCVELEDHIAKTGGRMEVVSGGN